MKHKLIFLVVLLLCATAASAAVIGTELNLANEGAGGVIVGRDFINWYLPATFPDYGTFQTGGGTNVTYNGGTIVPGEFGQILDLQFGPPVVLPNFLTFSTDPGVSFALLSIVPGGATQGALNDCAGVTATGVSCSPRIEVSPGVFVTSPFVITRRATYTEVSLGMILGGRDADYPTETIWEGGFTTQVSRTLTPDAIQALINSGGVVDDTYSGRFEFSQVIPEPSTYALMGAGLLALGWLGRRRKA